MSSATSSPRSGSGRYNKSCGVCVPLAALDKPFAKGHFRWVAKGVYTSGPRQGEACAVKWLKSGAGFEESGFMNDVKIVDLTLMIVRKFNKLRLRSKIKVNIPEVATMEDPESSSYWAGRKVLVEPFIENYQKFNCNTGSNDSTSKWGKAMQALSHFSYNLSKGEYILCDLQGGIYKNRMILTDPAILTRNGRFGASDLGEKGIINFFKRRVCNRYCRSDWIKPVGDSPRTAPRHSYHSSKLLAFSSKIK
ncbi:elongation factor 2 kinase [Trichoderma austrokoningii]